MPVVSARYGVNGDTLETLLVPLMEGMLVRGRRLLGVSPGLVTGGSYNKEVQVLHGGTRGVR